MTLILTVFIAGCSTIDKDQAWGEKATLSPGWPQIKRAFHQAFYDPHTWIPLTSAALFAATPLDDELSEWAIDKTPLFGSTERARDYSDYFREATRAGLVISTIATPSGETADRFIPAKLKGAGVQIIAIATTNNITGIIKRESGRDRPVKTDTKDSFPSAHASSAAVYATLTRENLTYIPMHNGLRQAADYGMLGLSYATAWARVEGQVHYPSDVLLGEALGNFMAIFVNNAFLWGPGDIRPTAVYRAEDATSILGISVNF